MLEKQSLLILASFVVCSSLAAGTPIETMPIPEVYQSAFGLGRGGAGIAAADDEEALFLNPAGLALFDKPPLARSPFIRFATFEENINRRAEGGLFKRVTLLSPMAEVSEVGYELYQNGAAFKAEPVAMARQILGKNLHVGANNFSGVLLRRIGLGVFSSARGDAMLFKNADYGGLEAAAARVEAYAGVTAGFGESFASERILAGVSYRYLYRGYGSLLTSPSESAAILKEQLREGETIGKGRGQAIDLGVMLRTDKIKAGNGSEMRFWCGGTLKDIGGTEIKADVEPSPTLDIAQTVNLGSGVDLTGKDFHVRLLADALDVTRAYDVPDYARFRYGMEFWLSGTFGVTGGLRHAQPSAGFFLDLALLRLDAGTYSEELGRSLDSRPDRRFFARLSIGL